jgi:hypothetical protein
MLGALPYHLRGGRLDPDVDFQYYPLLTALQCWFLALLAVSSSDRSLLWT